MLHSTSHKVFQTDGQAPWGAFARGFFTAFAARPWSPPQALLVALLCLLLCVCGSARLLAVPVVQTIKDSVHLRSRATADSPSLGILLKGQPLIMLERLQPQGEEMDWLYVQTSEGRKGYVREDMLSPVHEAPAPEQDIIGEGEPNNYDEAMVVDAPLLSDAPEIQDVPSPASAPPSPNEPEIMEEQAALSEMEMEEQAALSEMEQELDQAVAAKDNVNLRQGPSTDTPSLGRLPLGHPVTVLQRTPALPGQPGWLRVALPDGRQGYLREDMAALSGTPQPFAAPPVVQRVVHAAPPVGEPAYVAAPAAVLRAAPDAGGAPLAALRLNQTIFIRNRRLQEALRGEESVVAQAEGEQPSDAPQEDENGSLEDGGGRNRNRWLLAETIDGVQGYLPQTDVGRVRLELLLREKLLVLCQGTLELARFKAELCLPAGAPGLEAASVPQQAPDNGAQELPSEERGDAESQTRLPAAPAASSFPTPGRYTLFQGQDDTLVLGFPTAKAARTGLQEQRLGYASYARIIHALHQGQLPPQNTPLGQAPRIACVSGTEECRKRYPGGAILLDTADLESLRERLPGHARLDVYLSASQRAAMSTPQYISSQLVASMYGQLEHPAHYSPDAVSIIPMPYPMGDIPQSKALCADVVIRSLRKVGLDLQALVHEDIITAPDAYGEWCNTPNPNIDHRRVRNLETWFRRHTYPLPLDLVEALDSFQPGDIVFFDTGVPNGTPFDHIGLLSMQRSHGLPTVFTVWDRGYQTQNMPLLGRASPELAGRYRLAHPYEYQ